MSQNLPIRHLTVLRSISLRTCSLFRELPWNRNICFLVRRLRPRSSTGETSYMLSIGNSMFFGNRKHHIPNNWTYASIVIFPSQWRVLITRKDTGIFNTCMHIVRNKAVSMSLLLVLLCLVVFITCWDVIALDFSHTTLLTSGIVKLCSIYLLTMSNLLIWAIFRKFHI